MYLYVVVPAGDTDISDSNKCTYVNIMTTTESMDSKCEYMSLQNPAGKIYLYMYLLKFKKVQQMFYKDLNRLLISKKN